MSWTQALRHVDVLAGPWTDAAVIAVPLATVLVALLTLGGSWLVRRQQRPVDEAGVRKAAAETTAIEVATARALLEEVKAMLDIQRAHYEGRLEGVTGEMKGLAERVAANEEQQRALRAAFAAHQTWDADAVAALRTAHPEWPDPPPVGFDER